MKYLAVIKKKSGFALVELLIYMALMSMFLIVLTEVFVSILDVRSEAEATSAVDIDGRFIMARFFYDISRSSAVTLPVNLGDTTADLDLTIGGVTYSYGLNGRDLELTNNLGTFNLNSSQSEISGITFQKLGEVGTNESVRVTFTIESKTVRNSGPEVRNFVTNVSRR